MTPSPKQRIVVTGLGATTPVGANVTETWEAVLAGQSGVALMPFDWVETYQLPVKIAATIKQSPLEVLARVEARRLDPSGQYGLIAAREAWDDAGTPEVEPERLGVVIGTGIGGVNTLLDQWDTLKEKGVRRVFPLAVPMLIVNGPAAAVSLELGARAGAHAPVSACSSGAEAIGYAVDMIRNGRADVVVAGGTEAAIHPMPIAGFAAMQALSTRNDDPEHASRPFDRDRDGFVAAEGSAVLVLEEREHALARGARIHAELLGYAASADAYHITAPEPSGDGAIRCVRRALERAGVRPEDIQYINAHGTGTPLNDLAETRAIKHVFGEFAYSVPISSTKSMTGHMLGAAGAFESMVTILAMRDGFAPPTINLENADPECDLDYVPNDGRAVSAQLAMTTSFGFGGHNACLVFAGGPSPA
jgi:3-oxoacyl-[acyl-carrier-protein] synthase II